MVKRLSNVDQNDNGLVNVPTPDSPGDAANKAYVDSMVGKNYLEGYPSSTFRYRVKGSTGSDSNDGRTTSTAFKTIDRVFSQYNKGDSDVRMYIDEPGTYSMNGINLTAGAALHITATVPGVVININPGIDKFAFYNAHVNIQGVDSSNRITITGKDWYLDSGQMYFKYVDILNPFRLYGSAAVMETCSMKQLAGYASNVQLYQVSITNTSPAVTPLYFRASTVAMWGSYTISNLSSAGSAPFFHCRGGSLSMEAGFVSVLSNKYMSAFDLWACNFRISNSRFEQWGNIASSSVTGELAPLYAENAVLWSGANKMGSGSSISLSANISSQTTGVILVWAKAGTTYGMTYTFIPKWATLNRSGQGTDCPIGDIDNSGTTIKYVYVSDNGITGNAKNTTIAASNQFELQAVLGV